MIERDILRAGWSFFFAMRMAARLGSKIQYVLYVCTHSNVLYVRYRLREGAELSELSRSRDDERRNHHPDFAARWRRDQLHLGCTSHTQNRAVVSCNRILLAFIRAVHDIDPIGKQDVSCCRFHSSFVMER